MTKFRLATKPHLLTSLLAVMAACAAPRTVPLTIPELDAPAVADLPGLHNVVAYGQGLLGGAAPQGEEGLRSLAALGVKFVVSVDGMTPELAAAEKLGLRYLHLPISYDQVPEQRRLQLAQVIANADGPIYMHCHHGKHRSAAALAAGMVTAGKSTTEFAMARMQVSGTSADYPGLWQSVREAAPLAEQQLRADLATFPKSHQPSGRVALMNELDCVFDQLKIAKQAGWAASPQHPDLVPAREAQRLLYLHDQLAGDQAVSQEPEDFHRILQRSRAATAALHSALRAGDAAAAETQFGLVSKSCKECHRGYRDR